MILKLIYRTDVILFGKALDYKLEKNGASAAAERRF
jgi:hypothetical protein